MNKRAVGRLKQRRKPGARSIRAPKLEVVAPAAPTSTPLTRRSMKTSEVVALDIVRDIVARNLKHGDKLPLESDLSRQYRVSRSSLREALRLLEVQGLVTIRPGPGGGTVVGDVQPIALGRTLMLHMHLLEATYDELLDMWELVEGYVAEQAALNPDRELVERTLSPFLKGGSKGRDNYVHVIQEGLDFHDAVNSLTRNRFFSFFMSTPGAIVTEYIVTTLDRSALEETIVHEHSAVAEAIISGNPAKARKAMQDHIRSVVKYFRAFWPRKVGEKIQWR